MLIQYFRGSYGKVEMGPMMASIMLNSNPNRHCISGGTETHHQGCCCRSCKGIEKYSINLADRRCLSAFK